MAATPPDLADLQRRVLDTLAGAWRTIVAPARDTVADAAIVAKAARAAPIVWLIGKVQSGKSSIAAALTGASTAEVGNGFRACTKAAAIFDFPPEAPAIRFLDTRGLGEASYDPAEDIAFAEAQAHLLLVVMKAMDPGQSAVLEVVRTARRAHPDWPVLVAHTSLHEAYRPGEGHPQPYPFDENARPTRELPGDLARALAFKVRLLEDLPGRGPVEHVAIDFTQAGDGFEPRLYGVEALRAALVRVAPAAITAALGPSAADNAMAQRAHQHILGYATAAAAADVVPVAGLVAVPVVQAKMLHSLAAINGVTWDSRKLAELAGALGTGVVARTLAGFGARELAKLVPVYGQTAGTAAAAAMSFATTFALGKAAQYYFTRRTRGEAVDDTLREVYSRALNEAFAAAAERVAGAGGPGDRA